MSSAIVQADERVGLLNALKPDTAEGGLSLPKLGLPKLFGGREKSAGDVEFAQAGDPRITALEEQIRALSGTIEELNFQILQMQEQMRKMQEDNEFRFQELEQKKTDAGAQPAARLQPTTMSRRRRPIVPRPPRRLRPAIRRPRKRAKKHRALRWSPKCWSTTEPATRRRFRRAPAKASARRRRLSARSLSTTRAM